MSTTLQGIIIGGTEYIAYVDLAFADQYLAADPNAANWRAEEDDDVKGRAIIAATRVLNRLRWKGSLAEAGQDLAWPRKGASDRNGAIDSDIIPAAVLDACCELARLVIDGTDINAYRTSAQQKKRIKAGSVEVENFRGAEGVPTPLPWEAWSLISDLVGGTGLMQGSSSTGTDLTTTTEPGYRPAWPI